MIGERRDVGSKKIFLPVLKEGVLNTLFLTREAVCDKVVKTRLSKSDC